MVRLFEQHDVRKQRELEGMWRYVKADGKEYSIPVPGCLEQHPELVNYRGKGTFYKKIYVKHKTNIRLEFKGVSHTADVFWDDRFLVHHYNAFTGFDTVVTEVEAGEHELRVVTDHSFGEASALHVPNDYYSYGGITRPVVLEEIGDVYIRQLHFTPYREGDVWKARIEAEIENVGKETCKTGLLHFLSEKNASPVYLCTCGDAKVKGVTEKRMLQRGDREEELPEEKDQTVSIDAGEIVKYTMDIRYDEVREWTGPDPALYFLSVLLKVDGEYADDLIDRVAFRTVEVSGRRILLNGKPIFLKGFNRHEDYGVIGNAIPLQLMAQDLDLMKEMGANAVRTCHYPNDERFLDLCDERGFLVWEENHARGFNLEKMCNPNFDRQCEDCIREMIAQHYNHPSIVIWGILNECASETEVGREKYQRQYDQIRSLDRTRPTTSATCRHFTDICLDLPDVVSFNIYSGWYQDIGVKKRHEQEMEWIEKAGGEGKPVIVSEFGAAAIYGNRDRGRSKWSEERQADIIRENLEVYREDDRLSGVFIWQFADCRVTEEEWWSTRARCHNNKGVVDEYRRPKEAFDVVKELFPAMGHRNI